MFGFPLHIGRQTVNRVIGDGDRLLFITIAKDGDDRAENFFASDGHVIGHVSKYRWLDIIAGLKTIGFTRTARNQRRAFLDPLFDQALDLVVLQLRHDWSDRGIAIRVTGNRGVRCGFGDQFRLRHLGSRHQHPGRGVARLAAVHHHRLDAATNSQLQVGIIQHDVRRFATKFLMHPLDSGRSRTGDFNPGPGRAGETHQINIGMRAHCRTDRWPIPVDQVEHALWYARRMQDFGPEIGAERCNLGRLQHHRAAGRQRRDHLAGDLVDRPVPRRDQCADADWLLADHRRATQFIEFVIGKHTHRSLEMCHAHWGLCGFG